MVKLIVFNALLLGCCGYALWRGGAPERIGASIFLGAAALTVAALSGPIGRFASVEVGVFIVDATMLLALVALALTAKRRWPLWIAAFQVIQVTGHAVKMADPTVVPWAYAFILAIWSYPMLLVLAFGTFNHQRRLKRFGTDPSWSSFSGRSAPPPPPTL